ncbi:uncharacterized protein LOC134215057 [Armigeres subalbatus]|uniref:uncharacterized protein LOC134215057 n=1 Tax=Armigeres subalbatus TaxID=124917 RepID=UPI002ED42F0C
MFKFFLVAALVPAMAMASVNFRACPNGAPTPTTLTVNACSGDECILVAGQPVNARASGIVSPVGSATATAHIVARIAGLDIGLELPAELENACEVGLVGGCPIVAGTAFDYVLFDDNLEVQGLDIPVVVEVGLTGDNGVPLACVLFDARIQ